MQPIFSNSNETFSTGAKRGSQAGKCRPDLTSPFAAERKGHVSARGAEHYGDRNWEKGMNFSRVLASICRHLMGYMQGDTSEDHLAQLGWNVDALLHFEEAVKLGILPPALNDLPRYRQQKPLQDRIAAAFAEAVGDQNIEVRPDPSALSLGFHGSGGVMVRSLDDSTANILQAIGAPPEIADQIARGSFQTKTCTAKRCCAYIAGPMRGLESFNFPAFDNARDRLLSAGFDVISPADIDRAAGDENSSNQALFCLRDFFSLYYLNAAYGKGQGFIVMLPGWETSVGASAEFLIARWLGLTVLDAKTLQPLNPQDVRTFDFLTSIRRFLTNQLNALDITP